MSISKRKSEYKDRFICNYMVMLGIAEEVKRLFLGFICKQIIRNTCIVS